MRLLCRGVHVESGTAHDGFEPQHSAHNRHDILCVQELVLTLLAYLWGGLLSEMSVRDILLQLCRAGNLQTMFAM